MANILVLDNSIGDRLQTVSALETAGHNVTEESDGRKALELANENTIHCVILDLVIIGLDGFKVIRILRDNGHTMPIIVQTGMAKDSMRDRSLELGADVFLRKPVNANALLAKVKEVLAKQPDSKES